MKKVFVLILIGIIAVSGAGCKQVSGSDSDSIVCEISAYTTVLPSNVEAALPNAEFLYFNVNPKEYGHDYKIGYALIVDGERTDNILYHFDSTGEQNLTDTEISFLLTGSFFEENPVGLSHAMITGGTTTGGDIFIEMPKLTGYAPLMRPENYRAFLHEGEELVLACFVGSMADNGRLRATAIGIFDEYGTIDEAMKNSDNLQDNPVHLIFYITALD
jgi:hypothetical protein